MTTPETGIPAFELARRERTGTLIDRVFADPAAHSHQPERDGWTCPTCGGPWPCEALRTHLLGKYASEMQTVRRFIGLHYLDAIVQLLGPDKWPPQQEVHDRWFGWTWTKGDGGRP